MTQHTMPDSLCCSIYPFSNGGPSLKDSIITGVHCLAIIFTESKPTKQGGLIEYVSAMHGNRPSTGKGKL